MNANHFEGHETLKYEFRRYYDKCSKEFKAIIKDNLINY